MKPAKQISAAAPTLTLAQCVARAVDGRQRKDGGIAWRGVLWVRDEPIANFRNDGEGGCVEWTIRNREAFEEFKALAVREFPQHRFEQADHLVGTLWDAAILKPTSVRS